MRRPLELLAERLREMLEDARGQALAHRPEPRRRAVAPQLLRAREAAPREPARAVERLHADEAVPVSASPAAGRIRRLRAGLRDPASVRDAWVLKELLDPPLAHRRRRRY